MSRRIKKNVDFSNLGLMSHKYLTLPTRKMMEQQDEEKLRKLFQNVCQYRKEQSVLQINSTFIHFKYDSKQNTYLKIFFSDPIRAKNGWRYDDFIYVYDSAIIPSFEQKRYTNTFQAINQKIAIENGFKHFFKAQSRFVSINPMFFENDLDFNNL